MSNKLKIGHNTKNLFTIHYPLLAVFALLAISCSFDYGTEAAPDNNMPDIVMYNVDYVRVRNGDPQVRFQAELVERYEDRRTMELQNFSFEQFGSHGTEIDAVGRAGTAHVELDSGNITLSEGVNLEVESEDIIIKTEKLSWLDFDRVLSSGHEEEVSILRENGTGFTGMGFSANARSRTWEFSGEVGGSYVHEDDEEEPDAVEADEDEDEAEAE
ncbi:MAG: LPS export ABC transporter periplasmic protein LptC [Treponema sp.]|nr:LPS export ABC transporter periplasmic protein LptC [Treponema sp.]